MVGATLREAFICSHRALQEGEIDRVGGVGSVKVDVRVIAATNRDMKQMVAAGAFREDLYYRLQGMVVVVPPLRDRREELPALTEQFRAEVVAAGDAPPRSLSTGALDELYRQDWPGNIRQLRTTVFRAMVLARGAIIQLSDVQAALAGRAGGASSGERTVRIEPFRPVAEASAPAAEGSPGVPGVGEVANEAVAPAEPSRGAPLADRAPRDRVASPLVELPRSAVAPGAGTAPGAPGAPGALAGASDGGLTPRLAALWARIKEHQRFTTQDHMAESGVSHRTALRDLQALVKKGFVERVGSRRGAWYRPNPSLAEKGDS